MFSKSRGFSIQLRQASLHYACWSLFLGFGKGCHSSVAGASGSEHSALGFSLYDKRLPSAHSRKMPPSRGGIFVSRGWVSIGRDGISDTHGLSNVAGVRSEEHTSELQSL